MGRKGAQKAFTNKKRYPRIVETEKKEKTVPVRRKPNIKLNQVVSNVSVDNNLWSEYV